jgi:hypothetical protein
MVHIQKYLILGIVLMGCKGIDTQRASQVYAVDSLSNADGSKEFRSFLNAALDGNWAREDLDQIVYLPTDLVSSVPAAKDAKDFMNQISSDIKKVTATQLYMKGKGTPLAPLNFDQAALSENPITFVIVPGVFGEFIKVRPFEEVIGRNDSSTRDEFRSKLANASEDLKQDKTMELKKIVDEDPNTGKVNKPLDELILLSELKGKNGAPMANVIEFAMPFMSLESLGSNESVANTYIRRLEKYFAVMGVPEHMVFVGYSRGTPLGLEMLSQAKNKPWIKNVKALVAHGGVIYGSGLADDIDKPGTANHRQVAAAQRLRDSLKETRGMGRLARIKTVAKNTAAWAKFAATMAKSDPDAPGGDTGGNGATGMNGMDFRDPGRMVLDIGSQLGIKKFFSGYSDNITRLKYVIDQLLDASRELKTSSRLQWWKTHTVPSHITYYALTAVMPDPDKEPMGDEISKSKRSFDSSSSDYVHLLASARALFQASGALCNDSQVTVEKARFWPRLPQLLNPAQPAMRTRFLGVVGTHHWGIALKTVSKMSDGAVNPFPREALLRAYAMQVAHDLSQGK